MTTVQNNKIPRALSVDEAAHRGAEAPGRAELLTDEHGVYGLAIRYLGYKDEPSQTCAIYRPDRLDECKQWEPPILQQIPRLGRHGWLHSTEGYIANHLLTAMLGRAGLQRNGSQEAGLKWWSDVPAIQHANRRRFHGLKRKAVAITNSLIRQALTAAPPDALKLARRFPLKSVSVCTG